MKQNCDNEPEIIEGGVFEDHRGQLKYFNEFDLSPIKRTYIITHFSEDTVRAWQGHKIESRWFLCVKGAFDVKLVRVDDWENPSDALEVKHYNLNSNNQKVLYIPAGYANGFKATEANSSLLIMSNFRLNEIDDEIRFNHNKWAVWKTE